ncbi:MULTISPECIES: glycerophosphodiester phosphodiesterase family protein [unclassified Leifsonia]|uniref:glycerophosphodiester phosphodiesterase family protein n=1 Tax=unclassified Leifsonia TaxID=2663824 RepID=UPI0006F56063|nr:MULTISPECIES: glycerophosphodiester phosphodiesterase family protein [unclassified Leifsonia]KQX07878.1 glycerophosphodiester phosphodiesterase [Leifsonia sp. Root1293]KRA12159.1 glycerophosphodiester phosphodiesterase [Leifsonia sp. Root60]
MPARPHPLVIGHRGASGYRPEHTASAYQLAFALGADAVEPDIVATRDGVLVLRHENEISETTDVASHPEFSARRTTKEIDGKKLTGWFTEDFTWAELATLHARERIPKVRPANASFDGRFPLLRLADLFRLIEETDAADGRMLGMVAEIKHASYFAGLGLPLDELFTAELAAAGWSTDDERLTIEAFEITVLEELALRGVSAPRVFLLEKAGVPYDLQLGAGVDAPGYADFMTETGLRELAGRVDGISVDKSVLVGELVASDAGAAQREALDQHSRGDLRGRTLVDAAHDHGLSVFTWTLRPENRFLPTNFRHGHGKATHGDWLGEFTLVLGTGVDGIFVDHPDLGVEARERFGR